MSATLSILPGGKAPGTAPEDKLRDAARNMVQRIDSGYMDLAKLIYKIAYFRQDSTSPPLWVEWGYKDWDDYCLKELNMSSRKADYFKGIYQKLEIDLAVIRQEVRNAFCALGWSKCRLLIRVIDERNIHEWISKAKAPATVAQVELSVQKYEADMAAYRERQETAGLKAVGEDEAEQAEQAERAVKSDGENTFDLTEAPPEPQADEPRPAVPEVIDLKKKVFMFHEAQEKVVTAALRRAGVVSGSTKDSELLTLICEEYLASSDMLRGTRAKVETLTRLASIMNVEIMIVEPETMNVVHGMPLMVKVAERAVADRIES